ncbi:type II toxin-antitoxin system ParD family antitoxin [Mesorhizobium sp. CU2]|uniref:type II toxin-antitoxin system ParD family antitoxin n=1 Tax=unclassified Mesorhizobium TaxID=325217 RepID=UPI00112D6935|nr:MULTISPECIES: type II toxin-antitoxin system ParD family antitoxin [unclassified Mesorhizobium]TPN81617.1 type II toxin-antitoxin system ParD family antitoxin [Mesorhizobium sp. CU3]TPO18091.1 type II toxin-antitoxin system ParD family antitoxin [Mesorhizobium sp. CU2]
MGQVDKRSITLSPELAQAVDDVVAAGEYASASEVIRDALRQWKDRRDLLGYTVEELRKLVQEGIDSGPGRFASMDEIKAEARNDRLSNGPEGGEIVDGSVFLERLRAKYAAMSDSKK